MKTKEKRERLLVALYQEAKSRGFDRFINVQPVADNLDVQRDPGELRLWVKDLDQSGKIEVSYTLGGGPDGGMSAMLTSYGVEEAEEIVENNPAFGLPFEAVNYVSSSSIVLEPAANLESLSLAVRGPNAATQEDRVIALAEIAIFETALLQPVVATDIIDRFVKYVLKWIVGKFPEEAVKVMIAAIILKLAPFLAT